MALAVLPDRLLSRSDISRLFGVHRNTVAVWEKNGNLPPPIRVGGTSRWHPRAIADLIAPECEDEPSAASDVGGCAVTSSVAAQEETPGPTNPEVSNVRSRSLARPGGGDDQRPVREAADRVHSYREESA